MPHPLELLLLSHAEFDVRAVDEALAHKDKHVDMLTLLEVFCTSLPSSLRELHGLFRHKSSKTSGARRPDDLVEVLRERLNQKPHATTEENHSAATLLVELLHGAEEAGSLRLGGVTHENTIFHARNAKGKCCTPGKETGFGLVKALSVTGARVAGRAARAAGAGAGAASEDPPAFLDLGGIGELLSRPGTGWRAAH